MSTFDWHLWIYLFWNLPSIFWCILCNYKGNIKFITFYSIQKTEKKPLCQNRFPPFSLPHTYSDFCYTSSPLFNSFENWNPLWGDVPQNSVEKKFENRRTTIQNYFRRLIQTPTERNNSNSTWGKSFICKLANAATKSELRWVISYFW